jgi:dTDP-4-amino-4,6-dideoxygalactose transaminase
VPFVASISDAPVRVELPFNRPYATGREHLYMRQAIENGHLSGNGPFTARCAAWLEERTGAARALLTASCTAALELSTLLAGIGPGDEVLMPSFTFVSTASAVVLRGATPVFVEIRPDTLNLDETCLRSALTSRTKAILPVHYAGVACDMDAIGAFAHEHGLTIIEDAAQGVMSRYRGRSLGGLSPLGCLSFHETKNVICGEGGALLVNDPALVERAEILQEKGTNRSQFFRGQVDKYTWVDVGSSFLTSDISASFLWAQLEQAEAITARRLAIWDRYHAALEPLERVGALRRPIIPGDCEHNAHMYYVLLPEQRQRQRLIAHLRDRGVQAVFHYVPLHSSPAGWAHGRAHGRLDLTTEISERLLRLPLWPGMSDEDVDRVAAEVRAFLEAR